MTRIKVLSAQVSNQIAAGEVIERPASVVKELLENALDSGATHIRIEIGFGGLNQITVSDDGVGICAEDLPLAIAAHATSKITQLSDLYEIMSMGFRGEALASIASVSRLSLTSKQATEPHATMLRREEDGQIRLTPCARSTGTTVDVRDLFFNAPVRKKFLKPARTEFQVIETLVKSIGLSAPEVALTLVHDGKEILCLPQATDDASRALRIKKIVGAPFMDHASKLDVEHSGMRLWGFVSDESFQRSQRDKQWMYLNGRMVKDKLMTHAINQAYEGLLHPGRQPSCLLYLSMPPSEVDVNVHPTKHEVRFQQPRLIHDFISSQIKQTLAPAQEMTRLPMSVRESYSSLAIPPLAPTARAWFVLTRQFLIATLGGVPCLIDMQRLQAHRLRHLLMDEPFPLASRPLLVPVTCHIEASDHACLEAFIPLLAEVGVQMEFISEGVIRVRTIPLLFPLLDFHALCPALMTTSATRAAVLERLIEGHLWDARQFSADDIDDCVAYLQLNPSVQAALCLPLDDKRCRSLLHG